MSASLQEQYGVAMSGVKWDAPGGFKLWQSAQDDLILFSPTQPVLAMDLDRKRYQAAVTQFRAQRPADGGSGDLTYKIIGGSAAFTITTAIQYDQRAMQQLQDQWRATVLGDSRARTRNPKFVPLNTRKGTAECVIPSISGKVVANSLGNVMGTPGGTVSFVLDLTAEGAQEWVQGVRQHKNIDCGVVIMYEYLQLLPQVIVDVHIDASKLFKHLSGQLKASVNGFWYGGSIDLQGQWEEMQRIGIIVIRQTGLEKLPDGAEEIKQNAMKTFLEQAFQNVFPRLFEPKPNVEAAKAGDSGGLFGGANFAMKWRKESDVTNLDLHMEFNGWTWLQQRADANVTTMTSKLDDSYVNEVNTEMQFPAIIRVEDDDQVKACAVAWNASEGHSPEAFVVSKDGGQREYTVTSAHPNDVTLSYTAKLDFVNPRWPVLTESNSGKVASGTSAFLLKPSAHIGRVNIYMYVKDDAGTGLNLLNPSDSDYLVLNVAVAGPHLKNPVKDSGRITMDTPLEFAYPINPAGPQGTKITFSAFGMVRNQLVRAPEQEVQFTEDSVFVLVSKSGVQLITQQAQLPEDDPVAQTLQVVATKGARPVITVNGVSPTAETGKKSSGGNGHYQIVGKTTGIEYGFNGPALWIVTGDGSQKRVSLRHVEEADHFANSSKFVKVTMDDSGTYADTILVDLG
jgi:hypothetical protein